MHPQLPSPLSSWYCIDGVVMSADVLPKPHAITGRVTAARQEIRRQMKLSPARAEIRRQVLATRERPTPLIDAIIAAGRKR